MLFRRASASKGWMDHVRVLSVPVVSVIIRTARIKTALSLYQLKYVK
jgi:hypothetical protein